MKLAKRKIIVTTGTRAEYGILRPILREIIEKKKIRVNPGSYRHTSIQKIWNDN